MLRIFVVDCRMKEIISLTFKSGSRPPLLIDVLRSAQAIGGKSKLVIEIKPGNPEACTALVRLFRLHPDLICRCAAVMSFDAWAMHKLRAELDELASSLKVSRSPSTPSLCVLEQNPPEGINDFQCVPDSTSFQLQMPEILLLTVANEPRQHYELWVDVSDFSPVYSWLSNGNKSSLDGVYLQFQHEMLDPSGISAMRELSKKYRIGVWGEFGHDPDNCITATQLIRECGVSFVNSDLPRGFMGSNAHFGA